MSNKKLNGAPSPPTKGIYYGWNKGWRAMWDSFEETFSKEEYRTLNWNHLRNLLISQFSIRGVDNDVLDEDIVMRWSVDYGTVAWFFDDVTGMLACLPCTVMRSGVGGKPQMIKVFSPSVTSYQRILRYPEDEFFVMYDNLSTISPQLFFWPWITQLSELSVSIDVNMFVQRTPLMTLSNIGQRLTMENIVASYTKGMPIIELKDNGGGNIQIGQQDNILERIKVLKLDAPYIIDKLEIERKNVWYSIIEKLGYKVNVNSTKKERLIQDEVDGNTDETASYYYSRKRPREKAVEWLQKHGYPDTYLHETSGIVESMVSPDSGLESESENGEVYNYTENGGRKSLSDDTP